MNTEPKKKKRVYIAGKMSGIPNFNRDEFNAAAKAFRGLGFVVVNPAEFDGPNEEHDGLWNRPYQMWREQLDRCIQLVRGCDVLYLLKGWEDSLGATEEYNIAKSIDRIEIYKQSDYLSHGHAALAVKSELVDQSSIVTEHTSAETPHLSKMVGIDDKPVKKDKRQWWIVPLSMFSPVIDVFTDANKKYGRCSYEHCDKNLVVEKYYSALMRHIEAWTDGEWLDKDSGKPHLAHAAANLLILLWHKESFK